MESVLTDSGVGRLLIGKTVLKGKTFHILEAEVSKADSALGESDITIVVDVEENRWAPHCLRKLGLRSGENRLAYAGNASKV